MTAAPAGCLRTPAGRGIAPVAVRSKSGTQPLRERELSSRPAAQPASAGPPRRPWLDDDQGARHRGQRLPPDDTRASSTPLRTTCKKSHDLCDLAFQSVDIDQVTDGLPYLRAEVQVLDPLPESGLPPGGSNPL